MGKKKVGNTQLRYKNPLQTIITIPFYPIVLTVQLITYNILAFYLSYKIIQYLCIIEDDEKIITQQYNKTLDKLKI